jgi:exonuclease VII large subunit
LKNNFIAWQKSNLVKKSAYLKSIHEKLIALNPNEILNRGYSITFNDKGETVYSSGDLNNGDLMLTKLAKGDFKSKVID